MLNPGHRALRALFYMALVLGCASLLAACATATKVPANSQTQSVKATTGTSSKTAAGNALEKFTKGMQHMPGFFDLYWDAKKGKMYLKVNRWEEEFLYQVGLAAGVGSNDIGLDRGQLGGTYVVKFVRMGPKVMLLQPNLDYRATTNNALERRAVNEAFAQSVLWGFTVKTEHEGTVLIDATPMFMADAHGVAASLRRNRQGSYSLDASRSALYIPRTKNFEENTEVEALLTFKGSPTGSYIRQVTPTASAVTVRQHHSLVQLPDDKYRPRVFDPRAGYFGISYADYTTPIGQPIVKRFISRHRLEKKNPNQAVSEPVAPIVYYLDPGTPEPVRSALLEGARWWDQAFEAAGFKNAFKVEMLPANADPMDVRYNVIQWVHRATRGWSYGASVTDPRTGEIIKGHVSLGSLRVRQDYLIAMGLLAPYKNGQEVPPEMLEMALARIRQLSAHEVGHTLGLAHNFAASTNSRASVMDYPHPLVTLTENGLVLDNAYDTGIGEWDKVAIAYGYSQHPPAQEAQALQSILQKAQTAGLRYISDSDARPTGGAHAYAHLWDNGADPTQELKRLLEVRAYALKNFGLDNLPPNRPVIELEAVLTPLYLMHRYQVEAVSKLVGGLYYNYAVKGSGPVQTEAVPARLQSKAVGALLSTLSPKVLMLPEDLLRTLPPPPPGHGRDREYLPTATAPAFDPVSAAEAAAMPALSLLLNPQRAARMIEQKARNGQHMGWGGLLNQLLRATVQARPQTGLAAEIQRRVALRTLETMFALAANRRAGPQVRAQLHQALAQTLRWLNKAQGSTPAWQAHYAYAARRIDQFMDDEDEFTPAPAPTVPPGSPIGQGMGSATNACGSTAHY